MATLSRFFKGRVQVTVVGPPCNIRRSSSMNCSKYDVLTSERLIWRPMSCASCCALVAMPSLLLAPAQGRQWIESLRYLMNLGSTGKRNLPAFRVHSAPLVAIKDTQALPTSLLRTKPSQVESIIHVKRSGSTTADAYRTSVPSRFMAHGSVVANGQPPLFDADIRLIVSKRACLRAEQWPVALLVEIIQQRSRPSYIFIGLFSGTHSNATAFLRTPLEQHRSHVSGELEGDPLRVCTPLLRR